MDLEWNSFVPQIVELLNRVEVRPDRRGTIEHYAGMLSTQLFCIRIGWHDHPLERHVTNRQAAKQLDLLASAYQSLKATLDDLSRHAIEALDTVRPTTPAKHLWVIPWVIDSLEEWPIEALRQILPERAPGTGMLSAILEANYPRFAEFARVAAKELRSRKSQAGKQPNYIALELAQKAAFYYQRLTLTEPSVRVAFDTNKAYGPFLELVTALFRLAGLKSSPEVYARKASRTYRDEEMAQVNELRQARGLPPSDWFSKERARGRRRR